jgi:hypothetical protein
MKLDKKATDAARKRHAEGIEELDKLFRINPSLMPFNPQTGRAVGETKIDRRRWKQWRNLTFPARVRRRRRRKIARASTQRNRRR